MSINGIGSYQIAASALYAGQSASTVQSGGDADRSRITPPTTGRNGLFTDTVTQTLFQIGITPTAANVATGAPPTNSQQQALNDFAQNLFGALQDAGTPVTGNGAKPGAAIRKDGRTGGSAGNDSATSPSSLSDAIQGSSLDTQIQNLAQQAKAGISDGNLAALQQSFQNLVSTQGGSPDASLGDFLQALSQNMQDVPPAGSLISTSA